MSQRAKKTEHSGAKKGMGAYRGGKKNAKEESNKKRRADGHQQSKEGLPR